MFRSVSIGSTSFGIRSFNKNSSEQPPINKEEDSGKSKGLSAGEKNSLFAGMFIGALMATTGTYLYNDFQNKEMIRIMQEELSYDKGQTLKIEDVTDDKHPDIILEDSAGHRTVFDIAKHNVYINDDGNELIEYKK